MTTAMTTDMLIVWCNAPDAQTAQDLATGLIHSRLAACVNVLSPVQSIYRWDNGIETATEVPLMVKTTNAAYPALEQWLQSHHPYTIAEIIALPVSQGLPAYLNWVSSETHAT
jgi:periplasmic divalent cation tolerance protein